MADYSGKSGNFMFAQIAIARRVFKWYTHIYTHILVNACGLAECEYVLV